MDRGGARTDNVVKRVVKPARRRAWCACACACALALVACDDAERAAPSPPAEVVEDTPPPQGYRPVELEDGGAIFGVVRWRGPVPEPTPLEVRSHEAVCGETQPSPALRVSERRGVADVVLWLTDVRAGKPMPEPDAPIVMDREDCRFAPHLVAVGVGWPVRFTNGDPILHNTHGTRDGATVLDFGLPEQGASRRVTFDEPGVVRLVCDAGHGWELGWVHVFDHPYFAVTGEDGRFRLSDVPPGQYVLRVWHEGWQIDGTRAGRPRWSNPVVLTRTVSVSPRQETAVDFQLSEQSATIAGPAD